MDTVDDQNDMHLVRLKEMEYDLDNRMVNLDIENMMPGNQLIHSRD